MIDLSGTITSAQLVKELGVSAVTAAKICKESGEGTKVGNSVLYDREAVKDVVRGRNLKTLLFLGLEPIHDVEYEDESSPIVPTDVLVVDVENLTSQYL